MFKSYLKKNFKFFFKVFCLMLALNFCCLINVNAANLQDKIYEYYNGLESFGADFIQILEHKESGSKVTRHGKLAFQKPLSVFWQAQKPHEETLVLNSREIWDYLPDEEIAYRYSPQLAQDSRNVIQVLTGQAKLNADFKVKNAGADGKLEKIILYPNEPSTQMVEAQLWVNPKNGQIQKVNVIDFYGNSNNITLNNFKENPAFSKNQFIFTPPKNIEIEDRMDKDIEQHNLFK